MFPIFEQSLSRYRELEKQLVDPEIVGNHEEYAKLAKEHATLIRQVEPYLQYKEVTQRIEEAKELIAGDDYEMKELAEEELGELQQKLEQLQTRLEDFILVDPNEALDSVIIEIRAGAGGDEAALFAGDLYNIYTRFCRERGWKVEDIEVSPGEQGGFKEITFSVNGDEVYTWLRYESGGHRVQRVPKTETQGRIHTSAATVAVLAEPEDAQIEIDEKEDLKWETFRASGAGGQHVNKTESAVRIWYKKDTPEELKVECQDERSQHKNRDRAMRILRSRLYERQKQQLASERADQRRTLVGSGDRSDRIRTYNFPQNRVTDHRIGLSLHKLDAILNGDIEEMLQSLREHDKRERLGGN